MSSAGRQLDRREFMQRSTALGILGAATAAGILAPRATEASTKQASQETASRSQIDLAEWSYFWLGVRRAKLARGTVVNGEQMYVEYWVPSQVRHPYAMVLVHGGGGQGLDWLGRPDGGPGWVTYLLQEGYKVYLVDRPGHGRSPFHPDLHGPFPPRASTYANLERQFTAPEKAAMPYGPVAKLHTQWPGTGVLGDPTVDQVIAGQGGSFLNDLGATHALWAQLAGELLDKIGPSIVMAHSAGGPSCWIYANARPNQVKGIIGVEPAGPPFGNLQWGLTASPIEYDPPVSDPSELKTVEVKRTEANRDPYLLLAQRRKLKHLQNIPIAIVTSPASYHWPYDIGTVAFLKQCGCSVEHIELEKHGITGNAHFMMMERNNKEVLQPILQFLQKNVTDKAWRGAVAAAAAHPRKGDESTAMNLADHGFFWTGIERKKMPYGVVPSGQMYVQYLVPTRVRHQTPVVLVHGGLAQMLHFMGAGNGVAGWAHYFAQAGYKVYLVDRPGHGRAPYHPDALGPITSPTTYETVVLAFRPVARGPNRRWMGTGEIGDPGLDQFMASQNGMPQDFAMQMRMWAKAGAELLDKIGPATIVTHSAGGPFGWLVAEERPKLVRAVACFEGAGAPVAPVKEVGLTEVRALKNVASIPMMFLTAENSGFADGPGIVEALNKSGAAAEHINLKDRGILGNGHFAMLETNRKQVFEVIRGWIESKVLATLFIAVMSLGASRAFAQVDVSGEWAARLHEDLPHRNDALGGGPAIGDYTGLPINDAARLKADSWDASILSSREHQAIPSPTVYSMRGSNMRISTIVDKATQRLVALELYRSPGNSGTTRTIWIDGRPHPPEYAAHTWEGFSTGVWQGGTLVVETSHLKMGFIQRNGVPTSDRATMTERFIRHSDTLTVISIVDDPIYLEEPFLRSTNYVLDLAQRLPPVPRQIVDEIAGRPDGYVPHHLPGTNDQLKEFADRFRIPFAATRGGKETTYPDYQATLKQLSARPSKDSTQ